MIKCANDNGFSTEFITCSKVFIHLNREILANAVCQIDCDYVLWIDADQIYDRETIPILASHIDSGKFVVAGMTADKATGRNLNYTFDPKSKLFNGADKTPMKPNQGIQKTDATGFGGVMMNPKVINELIKPPRFSFTSDETVYRDYGNIGEDFAFFWKCKKKKIRIWCDTDLKFGHLKTETVYSCEK